MNTLVSRGANYITYNWGRSIGENTYVVFVQTVECRAKFGYNRGMMNENRNAVIWGLNGRYYDAIMNSIPAWVLQNPDMLEDWFFSEIGL